MMYALAPLLFWAADRLIERPDQRRTALFTLVLALSAVQCSAQSFYYALLGLAVFVPQRAMRLSGAMRTRTALAFIGAGALALLLSAPDLLPRYQFATLSTRAFSDYRFFLGRPPDLASLATLLDPRDAGGTRIEYSENNFYFGLWLYPLALWGCIKKRKEGFPLLLAVAACVLLCFDSPLLRLMFRFLPASPGFDSRRASSSSLSCPRRFSRVSAPTRSCAGRRAAAKPSRRPRGARVRRSPTPESECFRACASFPLPRPCPNPPSPQLGDAAAGRRAPKQLGEGGFGEGLAREGDAQRKHSDSGVGERQQAQRGRREGFAAAALCLLPLADSGIRMLPRFLRVLPLAEALPEPAFAEAARRRPVRQGPRGRTRRRGKHSDRSWRAAAGTARPPRSPRGGRAVPAAARRLRNPNASRACASFPLPRPCPNPLRRAASGARRQRPRRRAGANGPALWDRAIPRHRHGQRLRAAQPSALLRLLLRNADRRSLSCAADTGGLGRHRLHRQIGHAARARRALHHLESSRES